MPPARLEYEPTSDARPVLVERDSNVTRIIVPMTGLYCPMPSWIDSLDLLSIVLVPLWMCAVLFVRTVLRLPTPPRALFEVTPDVLRMTLHTTAGHRTSFDWPRSSILEARANRYERGLWIHAAGYVKQTYLSDLPQSTIDPLQDALSDSLALTPKPTEPPEVKE